MMDKELKNQIGAQVVSKYKSDILPKLLELEKDRVYAKNAVLAVNILSLAVAFGYVAFQFMASHKIEFIMPVAIILVFQFLKFPFLKFREATIKKKIMPYFCSCFGDLKWSTMLEYRPDTTVFEGSNLFRTKKSLMFIFDDIFKGSFTDVPFEILDTKAFKLGKIKSAMDIITFRNRIAFEGLIIKFGIDKKFESNTVILPNKSKNTYLDHSLRKTEFEDVQFEDKFDVYTQDEVEARYLITTSFMERLNNLKTAFSVDKISCAFYKQNLLIALHTKKDLFKIGSISNPMTDYSEFSKLYNELMSIYDLIDFFKLSEKTKI